MFMNSNECPCEIWVQILELLLESDRRKLSVTCWNFNNIYRSFFRDKILSHNFIVDDDDCIFDRLIVYWSHYSGFFVINRKFFDFLGPSPEVVVNLNNTLTFSIEFEPKHHSKYPDLTSFSPFSLKIVQTKNCRLKFTHYHQHVYHVEGCSIDEIHSLNERPCFQCDTLGAIQYDLQELSKIQREVRKNPQMGISGRVRYNIMGKRCETPTISTTPLINWVPPSALKVERYEPSTPIIKAHPNQSELNKLKNEINCLKKMQNDIERQLQKVNLVSKYSMKNQCSNNVSKFNKKHR